MQEEVFATYFIFSFSLVLEESKQNIEIKNKMLVHNNKRREILGYSFS